VHFARRLAFVILTGSFSAPQVGDYPSLVRTVLPDLSLTLLNCQNVSSFVEFTCSPCSQFSLSSLRRPYSPLYDNLLQVYCCFLTARSMSY
jgi:hypothetical protein